MMTDGYGAETDVRQKVGVKITAVFAAALMPWPKAQLPAPAGGEHTSGNRTDWGKLGC